MRNRQTVDNARKITAPHLWPRLYTPSPLQSGDALALDDAQSHYIHNVMRKQAGDMLRLFNPEGGELAAQIELAGKKQVIVRLGEVLKAPLAAKTRRLVLLAAIIKKDPYDLILTKATELGATDIQPILTERTVVRDLNETRAAAILREAGEQCERLSVPTLHKALPLQKALLLWADQAQIFACIETEDSGKLLRVEADKVRDDDVALITGPEGGFTDDEIAWLRGRQGLTPVSLGPRIMKAETAALTALAILGPEGGL
jgi:16S rRNA (uracil1498-N3)-methyltransferase